MTTYGSGHGQWYGSFIFSRKEKCFSFFTSILIFGANGVAFDVCSQWRLTMMMAAYEWRRQMLWMMPICTRIQGWVYQIPAMHLWYWLRWAVAERVTLVFHFPYPCIYASYSMNVLTSSYFKGLVIHGPFKMVSWSILKGIGHSWSISREYCIHVTAALVHSF
jgi:hypothetical protein